MARICKAPKCGANIDHRGHKAIHCETHAAEAAAAYRKAYAKIRPRPPRADRRCVDCGADISSRGPKATRCLSHAQEAETIRNAEYQRRYRERKMASTIGGTA